MRTLLRVRIAPLMAALIVVVFAGSPGAADEAETPGQFMENFGDRAIKVLSETAPGEERRERELRSLLSESFDVEYISRFVLARFWRTASEEERAEFRRLFEDYVIAAYGRRFGTYSGEKFAIAQTFLQDNDRAIVRSDVTRATGDTFVVDWRVRKSGGRWRIVDIMVEGVSMMVTQRSEFTAVIQREGGSVAALNAKLRALTDTLNEQPVRKISAKAS